MPHHRVRARPCRVHARPFRVRVSRAPPASIRHPSVIHHSSIRLFLFPFSPFPFSHPYETPRRAHQTSHIARRARSRRRRGEIRACARTGHPDESRSANQSPPRARARMMPTTTDAARSRARGRHECATRGRRRRGDSVVHRTPRVSRRDETTGCERATRARSSTGTVVSVEAAARARSVVFNHSRIHSSGVRSDRRRSTR